MSTFYIHPKLSNWRDRERQRERQRETERDRERFEFGFENQLCTFSGTHFFKAPSFWLRRIYQGIIHS